MMLLLIMFVPGLAACAWLAYQLRRRGMDRWLAPYVLQASKRRPPAPGEEVHLLLCFADHFEPKYGSASLDVARARVARWVSDYPRQFGAFRDTDGRPPRYTFFYPAEEYEAELLDALAGLCRAGIGEVEVHIHHDRDTPAGNWALCNSRPDGRWCGVNNELAILRDTGCYADFTMPSAPHPTQTRKINGIYYACDRPGCPRSHDTGIDVGTSAPPPGSLLLIQGPLVLNWQDRKWGLLPHVENGCLQASYPPSLARLHAWLRARVQVPARPDWFFVKLYAHGAPEESHEALLGEPMMRFHLDLARRAREDTHFHYHYVTAREMCNLVKAAESGWRGSVAEALDYELVSNVGSLAIWNPAAPAVAATKE
jgi:hypothetical protein